MNLTDVRKAKIPRKKKFLVGRGESSGLGKTSGRGHKGQWARSGTSFRPYFEGGQMSIIRRIPKRGFNNKEFKTFFEIVHLSEVAEQFEAGQVVDETSLRAKGLLRRPAPTDLRGEIAELSALSTGYFLSDEGREGVLAFREKRLARWVAALDGGPADGAR